jgi:peroxiredoxin
MKTMKRLFTVLLVCPLFVAAQTKLTISGKIKGLKEGSFVTLTDLNNAKDTLGKAKVLKGAFLLKASLKEPMLVNLAFTKEKNLMTFLDNTMVKVTGDVADIKNLKVTGSPTHKDFADFQNTFDPLFNKLVGINQQLQFGEGLDSLTKEATATKNLIQSNIDQFITRKKSSPVSAFLLAATMQLNENVLLTESRLNLLKQSALENMYGIFLKEAVAESKIAAIGSEAIDFTQADTSGVEVSLSSFRGKYVLLDFWASWCGPCRQENPNVVETFQKFKDKNFTVLGVSLDRPGQKDKWLQAIHADNLTWTHVSDLKFWNNAVAQQYKVQSIPQNFLIGPDGKIVAKNLRGPALEAKLCEVIGGCN